MRAVMSVASHEILDWRKKREQDQWDEMWEGELHMPPMPNRYHNDLESHLGGYLRIRWARPIKAKVYHQINLASVGGWPNRNYRIPDLLLLTQDRFGIDFNEYFEGAPNVVIEIRRPGDETYEKFSFYAKLGVPELWVIQRDTGEPEIYLLRRGRYRQVKAQANGWVHSAFTGIEMTAAECGKLAIRLKGDASTEAELPEE